MPKVSVIVPVYNSEDYVERTIESLMKQTLSQVEFIIIDDGSKDNSGAIIKSVLVKYPERKNYIVFIQRENKGIAATRAEGVDIAKGEYSIHMDSDDWCEPEMLEEMYNEAVQSDADIVVCDYYMDYGDSKEYVSQYFDTENRDYLRKLLRHKLNPANWNKLVRHSLYSDHGVNFLKGFDMGEDFCVTLRLFVFAERVIHLPKAYFYYNRANINSVTNNYNSKYLNDVVEVVNYLGSFLKEKNIFDLYLEDFYEYKIGVKKLFIFNGIHDKVIFNKGINLYPEVKKSIIKTTQLSLFFKIIFLLSFKINIRWIFLIKGKIKSVF
jgi:glycosyltransferase involved in cell wall biosynthesis